MKQSFLMLLVSLAFWSCSTNNNGTVTVVPIAPTALIGTVASTTQINLSWTDNATNEDGYKIERKNGTGSFSVIGSTGSNLTTFNDMGLSPNTAYTYRVYAFNGAGNSLQYSNEVTLTTQDTIPSWLTNGLVAFYPFNGNANDESGNGNNGTVNGATLTSDRFGNTGKAYSFNGIDQYITTNSSFLSVNLSHSISIWWNTLDSNKLNQTLFNTSPHTLENLAFHYSSSSNNPPFNLMFGLGNGLTGSSSWNVMHPDDGLITLTPPTLASWQHFVWVKESNTIWKFYCDGNIVHTINTNSNIGSQLANIRFGAENNNFPGGGANFYGTLDDIRIYNRALSASEVAYLTTH